MMTAEEQRDVYRAQRDTLVNRTQALLYLLIRDHVPFGLVEKIILDLEKSGAPTFSFSEPFQYEYVTSLVARMLK